MIRADIYANRYLAGRVQRYHTWPTIHKPNVAEHSHRMLGIYVEIFGLPRAEVLMWMVNHDLGELYAGDVPFGTKQSVPGLKASIHAAELIGRDKLGPEDYNLTAQEFQRCKACDLLEMWEFANTEYQMGNSFAKIIIVSCREAINHLYCEHTGGDNVKVWHWVEKQETLYV